MKRLLLLPLVASPLLFISCDRSTPAEPASALDAEAPLFAKTPPNTVLDYQLQRLSINYSSKTYQLKIKVAFKNLSTIWCATARPNITLHWRWVSPTPSSFAILQGDTPVCDEPGKGGGTYVYETNTYYSPGILEIRVAVYDDQAGDSDVLYKEFTSRTRL